MEVHSIQPRRYYFQIACYRLSYAGLGKSKLHARTWCTVTTSPSRTRKFARTTLFMRILCSSQFSSANTIHTVSLRFLPCTRTVSGD
jgi:hypothetical protein